MLQLAWRGLLSESRPVAPTEGSSFTRSSVPPRNMMEYDNLIILLFMWVMPNHYGSADVIVFLFILAKLLLVLVRPLSGGLRAIAEGWACTKLHYKR